jgi:hypothetical protein
MDCSGCDGGLKEISAIIMVVSAFQTAGQLGPEQAGGSSGATVPAVWFKLTASTQNPRFTASVDDPVIRPGPSIYMLVGGVFRYRSGRR